MPSPSVRRQASLFITDSVRTLIEALRRQWDPLMAARIPAHITLLYDIEPTALSLVYQALTVIGRDTAPFRLHIGQAAIWETPQQGIYLTVADVDGIFSALQRRLLPASEHAHTTPHVTLLHPRTNGANGPTAWQTVQHVQFHVDTWIDRITLIENAGQRWEPIASFELTGTVAEH